MNNTTDTIKKLLLEHPFGGPDFGGCECGQIIGGTQDDWAAHLAPIIADATAQHDAEHKITGRVDGWSISEGPTFTIKPDAGANAIPRLGKRVVVTVLHEGGAR
jgi:hypothetical protein